MHRTTDRTCLAQFQVLFGAANSIAVLTVRSVANTYMDIEVRRHIPLHTWEKWHLGDRGAQLGVQQILWTAGGELAQVCACECACVCSQIQVRAWER